MQLVFWIVSVLLACVLLGLVVKGVLFFGWLIGWILIIALGFFLIEETLEMNWFIGLVVAIILLSALFNHMFG